MTPDPCIDKLARFTPNPAALDRDALLFNAGRTSVKSSRVWPILTVVLGMSQVMTLIFFWQESAPIMQPVSPGTTPAYMLPASEVSPVLPASPIDPSLWTLQHRWLDQTEIPPVPPAAENTVDSPPPLTVFSIPQALVD